MIINNIIANIYLASNSEHKIIGFANGKLTILLDNCDSLLLSYNCQNIIHKFNIILGDNLITRIVIVNKVPNFQSTT